MAITKYKLNEDYNASNHMEFLCDADSDVASLPGLDECAVGSTALILESGDFYILTPSGEWKNPFA